jgi:DNA-binding NarL/FixJ family response regulator
VIRVLVIDDNVSFLAAATEVVVAADGFELAGIAQTGEDGLELARLRRPHLALIDLNMPPGIDGYETASRMETESPETATVLMTATPDPAGRPNGVFDKSGLSPTALAELWERVRA